jgi:hypothetical protein
MQTLAFLSFELQAARRRFREAFAEGQVPAGVAKEIRKITINRDFGNKLEIFQGVIHLGPGNPQSF